IAVARPIRTKSDAAKLDGEVFSSGVPSPPSPPCTGDLGGLFPVPCSLLYESYRYCYDSR
ncbi:hypothetical protein, partial [Planktothrix agardhii]|uniref:hypothetical protein n=1 Tax=Planktothrix agardhii TaxID=1160 RepID=UPI003C713CCE